GEGHRAVDDARRAERSLALSEASKALGPRRQGRRSPREGRRRPHPALLVHAPDDGRARPAGRHALAHPGDEAARRRPAAQEHDAGRPRSRRQPDDGQPRERAARGGRRRGRVPRRLPRDAGDARDAWDARPGAARPAQARRQEQEEGATKEGEGGATEIPEMRAALPFAFVLLAACASSEDLTPADRQRLAGHLGVEAPATAAPSGARFGDAVVLEAWEL